LLSRELAAADVAAALPPRAVPAIAVARGVARRSTARPEARARGVGADDDAVRRPVRHLALGGLADGPRDTAGAGAARGHAPSAGGPAGRRVVAVGARTGRGARPACRRLAPVDGTRGADRRARPGSRRRAR